MAKNTTDVMGLAFDMHLLLGGDDLSPEAATSPLCFMFGMVTGSLKMHIANGRGDYLPYLEQVEEAWRAFQKATPV